jgi:hypothetical protein
MRMQTLTRRTLAVAVLFAATGAAVVADAQPALQFREGLWEITMRNDIAGQKPIPPISMKRCVTSKEIADLQAKASKPPGGENCKVQEAKSGGGSSTWRVECTGKMTMKGEGTVTSTGDTYSMQSRMTMTTPEGKSMEITSSMTGKRLGECKP